MLDKTLAEERYKGGGGKKKKNRPGSNKIDVEKEPEQREDPTRAASRQRLLPRWIGGDGFSGLPRILIGIGVGIAAVLLAVGIAAAGLQN